MGICEAYGNYENGVSLLLGSTSSNIWNSTIDNNSKDGWLVAEWSTGNFVWDCSGENNGTNMNTDYDLDDFTGVGSNDYWDNTFVRERIQ